MTRLLKMRMFSLLALLLTVSILVSACSSGSRSSANTVEQLLRKQCECINSGDWRGLYNCYSPNYRAAYAYDKFADDVNNAILEWHVLGFRGKFALENVHVIVEEETAYITYVVKIGNEVVHSYTKGDEDICIKYGDKWYIVEMDASNPGYNETDGAKIRAAKKR